ncbi:MAG: SRPBCC family protein [Gemmatimonadota bacterium]
MGDRIDVVVTHDFAQSPERVFDAWLDPDLIARWMFGPELRGEEVQGISVAPRVGGSFSFRVLRGSELLDHSGHYLEMERPRRLAFTWGVRQYLPESSTVYIDIEHLEIPAGVGARLKLTHRLPEDAAEHAERTRKGWTIMLRSLERKLR